VEYGVGQYDSLPVIVKQGDQNGDEKLIGICHINLIRPHAWRTYHMYTCLLEENPTDKLSIKLVLKVNGQGSMRLDYFKFFKCYEFSSLSIVALAVMYVCGINCSRCFRDIPHFERIGNMLPSR